MVPAPRGWEPGTACSASPLTDRAGQRPLTTRCCGPPALPVPSLSSPQSPAKEGRATEKRVWQQHPRGPSVHSSTRVSSCAEPRHEWWR